jgi:hypothetical protein
MGPGRPVMRVEICDPERTLAVRLADGNWVWIFALVAGGGRTRLISRNRIATPGTPLPVRLFNLLVMEPGSLVMERKMLLGIKERAENLARPAGDEGPMDSRRAALLSAADYRSCWDYRPVRRSHDGP